MPRLNSSTPSAGHGMMRSTSPWSSTASDVVLEHLPADLGLHVRALGVPRPRPQHVARADQLDAVAAEHVHLA